MRYLLKKIFTVNEVIQGGLMNKAEFDLGLEK